MGVFKKLKRTFVPEMTPERRRAKTLRQLRQKEVKATREKAFFEGQLESAKREGRKAGRRAGKGSGGFMDKLNKELDVMGDFGESFQRAGTQGLGFGEIPATRRKGRRRKNDFMF